MHEEKPEKLDDCWKRTEESSLLPGKAYSIKWQRCLKRKKAEHYQPYLIFINREEVVHIEIPLILRMGRIYIDRVMFHVRGAVVNVKECE